MKRLFILFVFMYFFSSCNFMEGELKKLNVKTIKNTEIQILWYDISTVTTIHEHVEVSKDGQTQKIAELNQGGITRIYIHQDTIHLQTKGGLFYQLDEKAFNYTIVLDTIQ